MAADKEKKDSLGMEMTRRDLVGAAVGGAGIKVLRPIITFAGALASAVAMNPTEAMAAIPAGFKWFNVTNAQNRGSALRSIGDDVNMFPEPTISHSRGAVRAFGAGGMSAAINNDGRIGWNQCWFPGGDGGVETQKSWVCAMEEGDSFTVVWPQVGEYYGDAVGCRMWVGGSHNSGSYNNWGSVNGSAGNVFASALGARRFVIVPKCFGTNHYMLGVDFARFTYEFFYTGDQGNIIPIDTAYMTTGSLMADCGGNEYVGPADNWLGNAYIPDGENNSTVEWRDRWGYRIVCGNSPDVDATTRNMASLDFSGTKMGVVRGDTVGQIGYFMNLTPLVLFIPIRLSKWGWNGWGDDAPSVPNGVYRVYVRAADGTRKFLDVSGGHSANGTRVQVWDFGGEKCRAQTWTCVNVNGSLRLRPATNMSLALDDSGGKVEAQDKVQVWDNNGTSGQKFFCEDSGVVDEEKGLRGYYVHCGSESGPVLDIEQGKFENGAKVQLYNCNRSEGQVFYFCPIDGAGASMVSEVERFRGALTAPPSIEASRFRYSFHKAEDCKKTWSGLADLQPGAEIKNSHGGVALGYELWPKETATPPSHVLDPRVYKACFGGHGSKYIDFADYPKLCSVTLEKSAATSGQAIPDGVYKIRNRLGGYLDVQGNMGDAGSVARRLQIWDKSTDDCYIVHNDPKRGALSIMPAVLLGFCLDVTYAQDANATKVQTYSYNADAGQLWVPEVAAKVKEGSGPSAQDVEYFWLHTKLASGRVLDTYGGNTALNTDIQIYDKNSGYGQQWAFEPVCGKTFAEYKKNLPESFSASGLVGTSYGLFEDKGCTKKLCEATLDGKSGQLIGKLGDVWCGVPYYVKETACPSTVLKDETVYCLYASANQCKNELSAVMVDRPDWAVTVHFVCLDKDVKATEVSSYQVPCGADVSTSDEGFAAADALLAGFYGVGDTSFVLKWFEGTKDKKPGGDVFNDPSKSFSGRDRVGEDIWLYAWCQTATVTFYCDGTDEDHVVMVDESVLRLGAAAGAAAGGRMRPASLRRAAGKKVKARFTGMYLGTRFTVPDGIYEAAALPGCTPGWDGWYTDKDDLAVTSDTPGQGGGSKLASLEITLTKPLTNLYSVNRATLTHGYAAGSLTPDLDEVQTGPDGRKVFRKRPDFSSADALGTISLPADRVARLGVKSLPRLGRVYAWCEGDKWRALSPAAWYADESAEGAEMSSVDLERDTRVYVKWQWDVADGIVDKRV